MIPAELEKEVPAQLVTPEPLGPATDQITPPSPLVGATPAEPVTVAVKLIVEGMTPVSLSVKTTEGVTFAMVTVVGNGAGTKE